jgi:hypothetical protein
MMKRQPCCGERFARNRTIKRPRWVGLGNCFVSAKLTISWPRVDHALGGEWSIGWLPATGGVLSSHASSSAAPCHSHRCWYGLRRLPLWPLEPRSSRQACCSCERSADLSAARRHSRSQGNFVPVPRATSHTFAIRRLDVVEFYAYVRALGADPRPRFRSSTMNSPDLRI